MLSDTEIKENGLKILFQNMENTDVERFIMLIKRDTFDYTRWRQNLWEDIPLKQLYDDAKKYWENRNFKSSNLL